MSGRSVPAYRTVPWLSGCVLAPRGWAGSLGHIRFTDHTGSHAPTQHGFLPADGGGVLATPGDARGEGSELGGARPLHPLHRLRWWREVLLIAIFYLLYSVVRDIHGTNTDAMRQATTNAHRVISLERHLGVFRESSVQHHFLGYRGFMQLWDAYYGSAHFVVVVIVLVVLYFSFPERYRVWRNTLAITTGLALVGFAVFPLLPPRLLGAPYHFVDTLKTIGGLWDFDNKDVSDVSNLYAAMPSLHTAWSMWCALAVMPVVRPRWARPVVLLYPLATIFCIVITANHYFADAAGGFLVLAVAYLIARRSTPALTAGFERAMGSVRGRAPLRAR